MQQNNIMKALLKVNNVLNIFLFQNQKSGQVFRSLDPL